MHLIETRGHPQKPLKAMEPGDADSMMALLCREPSALARS